MLDAEHDTTGRITKRHILLFVLGTQNNQVHSSHLLPSKRCQL